MLAVESPTYHIEAIGAVRKFMRKVCPETPVS